MSDMSHMSEFSEVLANATNPELVFVGGAWTAGALGGYAVIKTIYDGGEGEEYREADTDISGLELEISVLSGAEDVLPEAEFDEKLSSAISDGIASREAQIAEIRDEATPRTISPAEAGFVAVSVPLTALGLLALSYTVVKQRVRRRQEAKKQANFPNPPLVTTF